MMAQSRRSSFPRCEAASISASLARGSPKRPSDWAARHGRTVPLRSTRARRSEGTALTSPNSPRISIACQRSWGAPVAAVFRSDAQSKRSSEPGSGGFDAKMVGRPQESSAGDDQGPGAGQGDSMIHATLQEGQGRAEARHHDRDRLAWPRKRTKCSSRDNSARLSTRHVSGGMRARFGYSDQPQEARANRNFSAYPLRSATGVPNPARARHEFRAREGPLQAGSPCVSAAGGAKWIGREIPIRFRSHHRAPERR